MMNRMKICFILLVALDTVVGAQAQRPNVIYILADDLGYGDLSCYGQKKLGTPNIDRLSAELNEELRQTGDPRVIGGGDKFDTYSYFGSAPKYEEGKSKKTKR